MSYPDEFGGPIAPFAGDQTGQILAEPDVVALSPVTSARVVETQSGYVVVVKRADERLALSVKRRIGTPPSSQVLLTCDETINLSRILSDSAASLSGRGGDYILKEAMAQSRRAAAMDGDDLSAIYSGEPMPHPSFDWDEITQPLRKRKGKQTAGSASNLLQSTVGTVIGFAKTVNPMVAGGAVIGVLVIAGIITVSVMLFGPTNQKAISIAKTSTNEMAPDNVDKFVRTFVANMLDFNPKTYKASQIHAMAVMKPALLDRFWKETGFPLSKAQLKSLPKEQTLIIDKVVQQPNSSVTTDIDVYAELVTPGQESSPVHILMELGINDDGNLVVQEMKDASSAKEESKP